MIRTKLPERFWDKVWATPWGCWLWGGAASREDYGEFAVSRRPVEAHRLSYIDQCGPIPEGLEIEVFQKKKRESDGS